MRKRSTKRVFYAAGEDDETLDEKNAMPFDQSRLPVLPESHVWRTIPKWPNWRYVVALDTAKARYDAEYHRELWVCCLRGRLCAGLIAPTSSDNGYWLSKKNEKAEIIQLLAKRRLGL